MVLAIVANSSNLVNLGKLVLAILANFHNPLNLVLAAIANSIHLVITTLVHLANLVNLVNLVLAILVNLVNMVHLVILVLTILVNLVNLEHLVHLANWILDILFKLDIQKTRNYLTEIKTFHKIPMVFKNLLQSVREKFTVKKKLTWMRKNLSRMLCKKKLSQTFRQAEDQRLYPT